LLKALQIGPEFGYHFAMTAGGEAVRALDIGQKAVVAGGRPGLDRPEAFFGGSKLFVSKYVVFLSGRGEVVAEKVPAGKNDIRIADHALDLKFCQRQPFGAYHTGL
jgi:hypothetical protein